MPGVTDSGSAQFERLLDWVEDRLGPDERAALTRGRDWSDDPDLAWLHELKAVLQRVELASPPVWVQQQLEADFEMFARGRQRESLFRRFAAIRDLALGAEPALAGVRGGEAGLKERQLVFRSPAATIFLNVVPRATSDTVDLHGQILATDPDFTSGVVCQLIAEDTEVAITTADELGEFVFEYVVVAGLELVLGAAGTEVTVVIDEGGPPL